MCFLTFSTTNVALQPSMPIVTYSLSVLLRSDVDIANDKFILETEHTDGLCVHSMTFDGEEVLFGKNKDLVSFWLDDNVECREDFMAADKVAVKNGEVNWDYCMS